MATKPPDFKASGIRAERLISSGSAKKPQLLMYNETAAGNNGVNVDTDNIKLTGTGSDTWLFISGALGGNDRVTFGGDVYISGSLYGVTVSATPASPVNSIQFNNAGIFGGSSNLTFVGSNSLVITGSSIVKGALNVSGSAGITGSLVIKDDIADTSQLTLSSSAGNTIFNMYSDGVFYLTNNAASGKIVIGATQPDLTQSQVIKIYPQNNQRSLTVFNETLAGSTAASPITATDTNFFVNGIPSSKGSSQRGTAVFGGDLLTSGSIYSLNGNATVTSTAGSSTVTLTSPGGTTTLTETNAGNLEIRNTALAGQFLASVKTSNGVTCNFLDVRPNGSLTGSVVSIFPSSIYAGASNPFNSSDTTFFVAGKSGAKDGNTRGTAVFGGDTVISGSSYLGTSNTDKLVVNSLLSSNIIPDGNRTRNLGSDTSRFANIYTGDLHLKNDRGDYTLIEEEDCLTIRFNKTGKRYKFVLERAPEYDE